MISFLTTADDTEETYLMNEYNMTDQVAIVTGAARGFGLAISERLMQSGVRVFGWDQDPLPIADDQRFTGIECIDVTERTTVQLAVDRVLDVAGRIDILVNNAGINGPQEPVEYYPLESWDRIIDVDLTAVFVLTRAVVPYMKSVRYGRIVTIASQAGKEGIANVSAYNAAKAGAIGFMKGIASELATFNITANSITPTLAETDLMNEMSEEYIAGIKERTLMGRLCHAEEVANMVAFVASPACSYSTGACFDVSGGRAQY